MAKKDKEGATKEAPLLKKWFVCVDFYDLQKQRVVTVGEEVEHNERREELGLIRQE